MFELYLGLGLTSVTLIIIGLIAAVYIVARGRHRKAVVYEVLPPIALSNVEFGQSGYSLQVVYRSHSNHIQAVQQVFLQYVRLVNFSRDRIIREDFISSEPFSVVITGGEVIDISVAKLSNPTSHIRLGQINKEKDVASSAILFDHLDPHDEVILQIVSASRAQAVTLQGRSNGAEELVLSKHIVHSSFENWIHV